MARNSNQVPNSKIAVYPGSFDPFTNGHLDVVDRALAIFDTLIVAVAANPEKRQPLFTVEERLGLIRASLEGRDRVEVASFTGLTVEYARARGARTLVKGLRAYSDFDAELSYVTGGMTWQADYNVVAPQQGDVLDILGWVTIDNYTGKAFENAKVSWTQVETWASQLEEKVSTDTKSDTYSFQVGKTFL